MEISTSRFGAVEIEADDILLFPSGLVGFEECRHWVILADSENEAVAWLQCITHPGVAAPVISPRRFLHDYQVRLTRSELSPLQLSSIDQAYVLAIVSREEHRFAVNLKAPIIVNLDGRLGRQVITSDDQPMQFELTHTAPPLRKSA
ncbi:flagellar assembly protein FliW [Lignipirellula cremea]|uniref:Flagellar assembly factor FliW n=1 Tax=Lignipirellula cremea TaxID=2528010 RepID=A0A518DYV3_9BACT|nr:flagellar assembly protein FliW [Lignipirellula cremea]QDU97028.1 Flagellar assembly factor FliW [Lignipirellula cremea]